MQPTRRTPILGAAIATAIAASILIALGIWQLQRLAWKQNLLAQIDAAEAAPPRPIGTTTPPLFARVTAQGTLAAAPVALYGAEVRNNHMGAQLIERLDRPGLPPILAVLGWIPTDSGQPRPQSGSATITGYIRLPETPNWLSAADDPEGRHFYTLNPATIGPALGAANAAPYILVAMGAAGDGPIPAETLPRPVNNHLQYALTWFGLAAALLGVFTVWARPRKT